MTDERELKLLRDIERLVVERHELREALLLIAHQYDINPNSSAAKIAREALEKQ